MPSFKTWTRTVAICRAGQRPAAAGAVEVGYAGGRGQSGCVCIGDVGRRLRPRMGLAP
jgi:hypothetical protein